MMGLTVILVWVPARIRVTGKEMTEDATQRENVEISIPYSKMDIKTLMKHETREMWQKQRKEQEGGFTKYKERGEKRSTGRSRKEETIITRSRLGHTGLNSTLFQTGKHPTGTCDFCQWIM